MGKKSFRIDIISLFPEYFKGPFSTSLISKALNNKLLSIKIHDLRRYGLGKHKQVDDRPFGGGPGMVLKPEVLTLSLEKVKQEGKKDGYNKQPYVIILDPAGKTLDQQKVQKLSKKGWVVLICGHYEGFDERFKDLFADEEISIGDYILSGGESAAAVLVDSISRLIPGFASKKESIKNESFTKVLVNNKLVKLLDYPVYTRPLNFLGQNVPEVLMSGNHKKIKEWRLASQLAKTKKKRTDLLKI